MASTLVVVLGVRRMRKAARVVTQLGFLDDEVRADFSPCRRWRYALYRRWSTGPTLMVVGLNPSTADEVVNDPTVTRCIGFAKREGYGGLTMTNLFAWRSTDPRALTQVEDPVGLENDIYLATLADIQHSLGAHVLVAWGNHGAVRDRATQLIRSGTLGDTLWCLGHTGSGFPLHPLYLAASRPLVPYVPRPLEVAK